MNKKYILFFIVLWMVIQPFESTFASLSTRVRITAVKGKVTTQLVNSDQNKVCPLERKLNLTESRVINGKVRIKTGNDSYAQIEYTDHSIINISPNTEIILQGDNIYVNRGNTWFKIEKQKNGKLIIKTPLCLIGIRGTEFILEVANDGTSTCRLIEGSIEISDAKEKSKMMLSPGMEITIKKGSSTLAPTISNIKEDDKWWTDWPTLLSITEMPSASYNQGIVNNTSGNALYPIADSYVYAYDYLAWNKANWGNHTALAAGWHPTGGEQRAYLKFDVSKLSFDNNDKFILKLYYNHLGGSNVVDLGIYEVTSNWVEGRGTYQPSTPALPGELSWINQPVTATYPAVTFKPGTKVPNWIEVDITPLVKKWINGSPNYGFVIKPTGNFSDKSPAQYGFISREFEEIEKRPTLNLCGVNSGKIADGTSVEQPTYGSLPFFDDFSSGSGNWQVAGQNIALANGKLYWNPGNSLLTVLNKQIPMENIEIEFDGYCETNGINVFLHNTNDEGYIVILGGWFNAQSGSDVGKVEENRELVNGKVWEPKQWHHYKVVKCDNTLTSYFNGRKIYERNISRKFDGMGQLKFSSWQSIIGIDNVKVSECLGGQSDVNITNSRIPSIAGEWEITCNDGNIYKYNLKLVQYDNGFYGDMIRTNGSEANSKVEGQILPNGSIEFIRSKGNWKQYYIGEVNQESGTKANLMDGLCGDKGQEKYVWNAKAINASTSNISVAGQWQVNQHNGYDGTLSFRQDQSGQITGTANWNQYENGTINGQLSGNSIEFTIAYASGDYGKYTGTITPNGIKIVNGFHKAKNGKTASWDASKVVVVSSIAGQWKVTQHNGHIGTLSFQQNQSGQLTGNASWDRHPSGTIIGQISGNSVEFTISYPNGIQGIYKGNVIQNGIKIVNGSVTASDGRTSTSWDASKVVN